MLGDKFANTVLAPVVLEIVYILELVQLRSPLAFDKKKTREVEDKKGYFCVRVCEISVIAIFPLVTYYNSFERNVVPIAHF